MIILLYIIDIVVRVVVVVGVVLFVVDVVVLLVLSRIIIHAKWGIYIYIQ